MYIVLTPNIFECLVKINGHITSQFVKPFNLSTGPVDRKMIV